MRTTPPRAAIPALLSAVFTAAAGSGPVTVRAIGGLPAALRGAEAGAIVQLADGDHATERPVLLDGLRGTAAAPVVIRAEHRGRAAISGAAGFHLRDCEHVVLEGFDFTHDAGRQAILLENCRGVRVTRNRFRLRERNAPRAMEHWVYAIGATSASNRFDRNLFERKAHSGSPLFVRGDDAALVCSRHDRIDRNHFRDVIDANGANGHETLRTGSNDLGASGRGSFTLIEENLFERCSGESEIVSLKSSDNTVRNNTFVDCRGAICLRLGNRTVVSGNFMLAAADRPGCGGVVIYGFAHRILNNYFLGLTGRKHDGALALIPGTLEAPETTAIGPRYDSLTTVPATRTLIAFNTWIDCAPLQPGFKPEGRRIHAPRDCAFTANLVVHTRPHPWPLMQPGEIHRLRIDGNLGWTAGTVTNAPWTAGFRFVEPHLRRDDGPHALWRLTAGSPAVDAAPAAPGPVEDDAFGRPRSGRPDVGAEEFGDAPPLRRPLAPADVGPDAP